LKIQWEQEAEADLLEKRKKRKIRNTERDPHQARLLKTKEGQERTQVKKAEDLQLSKQV
jgi:hypothetical protein